MESRCPKKMEFGPCGGVRPSGGCEVDEALPCPWAHGAPLTAPPPATGVAAPRLRVLTDCSATARSMASLDVAATALASTCDAVLVGDHGGPRNDFPPSFMAAALIARGVRPWVTLSCRDRNRVALGAELAALAELGVPGVHCVTGDWQGAAGSIGEAKVFDLDALRLVEAARDAGLAVSVAATPTAPPVAARPARVAAKLAAGATVVLVNHCGGPAVVERFVDAVGAAAQFVPCVPVTANAAALAELARLPGVAVDISALEEVEQPDPVEVAVAAAERMLAVPGVTGVNLSGSAVAGDPAASARTMAAIGARLRGGGR